MLNQCVRNCPRGSTGPEDECIRSKKSRTDATESGYHTGHVRVVPDKSTTVVDDRVYCTDDLGGFVEPRQMGNDRLFVRFGDAQPADGCGAHRIEQGPELLLLYIEEGIVGAPTESMKYASKDVWGE
jgi:hypothetical protein